MARKNKRKPIGDAINDQHPVEEASSDESSSVPVKNQARGAALAGGIIGFFHGGPAMAFVLGYGSYHFAKKDIGEVGKFCRKTGDFTNKISGGIKETWEKSGNNEDNGNGDDDNNNKNEKKKNNFLRRKKDGPIKTEECNESEPLLKEESKDDDKKMKKKKLLPRAGRFIGLIGKSIKKSWDDAESIPLEEKEKEEETSSRTSRSDSTTTIDDEIRINLIFPFIVSFLLSKTT